MPKRIPPNLHRRSRPQISPRIRITIFCEGRNTEPEYFKEFAGYFGNQLVEICLERAGGTPRTLLKSARREKGNRDRSNTQSYEQGDQIWIAFDCDDHPYVRETINLAKECGVGVAYSNPCFEVWALIHFQDHNAPLDRNAVQKLLRAKLGSYDPNGSKNLEIAPLIEGYEQARDRANRMCENRILEGDPEGNPFTSVVKLTELIVANGKRR